MPAKETVKIRAKHPEDDFGDPIGPAPAWRLVPGSTVVPRSGTDEHQRGEIITSGFMVRLPAFTPILDDDELEIRGKVHQIDGVVGDYGKKGKLVYTVRIN